jgi:two-component system NarL family sensor kinase
MKTFRHGLTGTLLCAAISVINSQRVCSQMVLGLDKDSLRSAIEHAADDTNNVNRYIVLGQQYENNIPDSAVYYYQQANQLSTRLNFPSGIIRYINNYTAVLNVQGRFDESLALHNQALALAEKHHLEEFKLKILLNIGVVYQYKEEYEAAANHYLKSLPEFERTANAQSLSLLYGNLCGLYRNLNQPQKALEFAKKSVSAAEKSQEPYTMGRAYQNMSNALEGVGKNKERELFLYKAYELGKQLDDIDLQETSLINLGDMLSETAAPEVYISFYRKALPLADSLSDSYGKSLALQGISSGLFRSKKYREAEQMAMTSLAFARENEQHESEAKTLMLMSDIKIALGDLNASAQYRRAYDSVYASIVNKDLVKNVQELETRYQVEKKQSQLLKQQLQLEQKNRETATQRTWLWVLVAGLLVMGMLAFWGIRYYRQRQLLNKKNLEALQTGQENLRLKSVMEGQLLERHRISQEMHDDMGSGLTSILFLSRTIQGQDSIATRLKQTAQDLIQKMNEIIWIMNHEQDTLDQLIAYMRLHIAETLDNAGIAYDFASTEPLPALPINQEFRRNIYLSCKEAVHNCIKHAHASQVNISVNVTERLEVIILDNGRGMGQHTVTRFGNGLVNMKRRMEQTGGTFSISQGESGTTVVLSAPLPV